MSGRVNQTKRECTLTKSQLSETGTSREQYRNSCGECSPKEQRAFGPRGPDGGQRDRRSSTRYQEPCLPGLRGDQAVCQASPEHRCYSLPDEDSERTALSVTQVAADLGLSRASVYRLLKRGALRRFKGGVAETSFCDLLREHPEAIPYSTLPRDQKEWLVLNGYPDPSLSVKRPSVRGLLD